MNYSRLNTLNKKYISMFSKLYCPFKKNFNLYNSSDFFGFSKLSISWKFSVKKISTKSSETISKSNKNYNSNIKKPLLLKSPIEKYENSLNAKNLVSKKYFKKAVIYMWFNKITGQAYVGSSYGGDRLASYFRLSTLRKNMAIYKSLTTYGHKNHMLFIMENLGDKNQISWQNLLQKEQIYIDWCFKTYLELCLNRNPKAGGRISAKLIGKNNPFYGKSHTAESLAIMKNSKLGKKNPMFEKSKSPEFLYWQNKDKSGANNPLL
jgi:group I intron endonuclease